MATLETDRENGWTPPEVDENNRYTPLSGYELPMFERVHPSPWQHVAMVAAADPLDEIRTTEVIAARRAEPVTMQQYTAACEAIMDLRERIIALEAGR
jgi:hypothetical protein